MSKTACGSLAAAASTARLPTSIIDLDMAIQCSLPCARSSISIRLPDSASTHAAFSTASHSSGVRGAISCVPSSSIITPTASQ